MENYKIVASDLDGTLMNNRAQISKENMDAIGRMHEKGIYFVPCSGRTLSEMPRQLREHADIDYIIYSNGAVVLDRKSGERILNCIPNDIVREILDIVTSCESHITMRHNGQCLVDAAFQNEQAFTYYNVIVPHQDCVLNYAEHLSDFMEYAYGADQVEVISVFFHDYADKLACRKKLEETGVLRIAESSEYNIEIFDINAGKGNALLSLADLLGVDHRETMSLGDSDNDYAVTQAAGLGLAVSNACDALKEVADEIICSNEEHVADYVLRRYFPG